MSFHQVVNSLEIAVSEMTFMGHGVFFLTKKFLLEQLLLEFIFSTFVFELSIIERFSINNSQKNIPIPTEKQFKIQKT